jgi:8-oxo-dGTP diphosphatase
MVKGSIMIEYIDIYDKDRIKTGERVPRKTTVLRPGQYMLVVLALIRNKNGKYLITQRTADKKWAALDWEIPGGGARAGETSMEAVLREAYEETGLDLKAEDGRVIYTYRNDDPSGDNYFTDIYLFDADFREEDISVQEEEVNDFKIASFDEIKRIGGSGHFLHYRRICEALGV